MILKHICEVCGLEEVIDSEEAYNNGWDYPPVMGSFTVVSPRTCGDCSIDRTLWWELIVNHISVENLNEHHKLTLSRILNEPESIKP